MIAASAPVCSARAWSWPAGLSALRERFLGAEPYPHIVLDGVFDPARLARIYGDLPPPEDPAWVRWWGGNAGECRPEDRKRGISDLARLPPSIAAVIGDLISDAFLEDVCALTGVPELAVDVTLNGAGLHCSGRGAALRLHADPIRHPSPGDFEQAINLILYTNPDWTADYGGDLELWSRDCSTRVVSIPPLFNRLVMFKADESTFHGHPQPNHCPEGMYRASIALYYYIPRTHPVEIGSNRPVWR